MINTSFYPVLLAILLYSCGNDRPAADEVPDSFQQVDSSLAASSTRARTAADDLLDSITAKTTGDLADNEAWKAKAGRAVNMAASVKEFIEAIKQQLKPYPPDALEPPNELMVKNGKGIELFNRLERFNQDVHALDSNYAALYRNDPAVNLDLPQHRVSWAEYYFGSTPVFAAVTMLTKLQNDISNEELRFVHYCLQQANKND